MSCLSGTANFYFLMSIGRTGSRICHRVKNLIIGVVMAFPYNTSSNSRVWMLIQSPVIVQRQLEKRDEQKGILTIQ